MWLSQGREFPQMKTNKQTNMQRPWGQRCVGLLQIKNLVFTLTSKSPWRVLSREGTRSDLGSNRVTPIAVCREEVLRPGGQSWRLQ